MELPVYQADGEETGRVIALAEDFATPPNDHVIWLDVRRTQASRRRGTHKTKERSEVRGSTRKLYRQKGTGMARSGNAASPIRRGGGRTFGPRPRRYRVRLSRKTRRLARAGALSYKVQNDRIRIVEALDFERPSTRQLSDILSAFGLEGIRVLVVTTMHSPALYRSSKNLQGLQVKEARNLCAEDILRAGVLLMEEAAVEVLRPTMPPKAAAATE